MIDKCSCIACEAARNTPHIERADGKGSGYTRPARGRFIPNHTGGDFYERGFWTHVTCSHGREVR